MHADWSDMDKDRSMIANGGTVTTSGSTRIHTFTTSGTFSVVGAGTVRVLVVGGGGGAGPGQSDVSYPSPGGGGQVVENGSYVISASGEYSVTVGDGGLNNTSDGGSSVFGTITAVGGKKGGTSGLGIGGASGNGNPGGSRTGNASSGGGGNGASGGDGSGNFVGGIGGAGTASTITGATVYYGGGGGGMGDYGYASGGAGGGGTGSNGTANTGGGAAAQFNGGSGVVIISFVPNALDIGLRRARGVDAAQTIPVEVATSAHKLRICSDGVVYGIPLTSPGSYFDSFIRIFDGSTVKAIPVVR